MAALAWSLTAGIVVTSVAQASATANHASDAGSSGEAAWSLVPIAFAVCGALIVSYQPRNAIGWLVFGPALAMGIAGLTIGSYANLETAPAVVGPGVVFAIALDNVSWMLFVFPLLHLFQVFPTGRVLSPRWRWLTRLEFTMITVILIAALLTRRVGPLERGEWTVDNPIGVLGDEFWSVFGPIWTVGLIVLTLGGASSLVVRYRRSRGADRDKLRLLLFAFLLFAVVYSISGLLNDSELSSGSLWDAAFLLSVASIPASITAAVIRRGLFDIQVVVRRTLVYTALTGLLLAIYSGSVFLARTLIGERLGDGSLAVAASTLLAAALFSPLRSRVQTIIDRRLFRLPYDAEAVIAGFTRSLRNRADVTGIASDLSDIVAVTVQPASSALWIRPAPTPRNTGGNEGLGNRLRDR